jgi:hypothetical protein
MLETGRKAYQQTAKIRRETKLFSDEDEALICGLAAEKVMAYDIAVKFGTTANRIKMICESHGVEVISKDNQKNKRSKQVLALLQSGYTTYQILNKVDCTMEFIATVRHRNGFSVPPSKAQLRTSSSAAEALRLVRDGMTVKNACACVGISTRSYSKYKKHLS